MRAIGAENARAADFGPIDATDSSASKNSRSIALREAEEREASRVAVDREVREDLERRRRPASGTFAAMLGGSTTS